MLDFEHGFENVDEYEYDYYSRAFSYDYASGDNDWVRGSMNFQVARPAAGLMENMWV